AGWPSYWSVSRRAPTARLIRCCHSLTLLNAQQAVQVGPLAAYRVMAWLWPERRARMTSIQPTDLYIPDCDDHTHSLVIVEKIVIREEQKKAWQKIVTQ
ncbi:MAG: hypothetical protein M3Y65_10800, partial [Pseudomonadota bacterium]|nr:hypothetical protein [Pseudomonadota bacterium]